MVEQPVENVRCIAHRGADDLGVKRGVLIRDVGIEKDARLGAVLGIAIPCRFNHGLLLESVVHSTMMGLSPPNAPRTATDVDS